MIKSLNGIWDYRIGYGKWAPKKVPFCALAVGHSECKRSFDLEYKSETVLLKFDGITYGAEVYLNGEFLGKMLPYCEYTFDISEAVKERDNSLLVLLEDIDAEFGPSEGWENYGGIIRDVSLIYKEKRHVTDVFFKKKLKNGYRDAEYSVEVLTSEPSEYRVTLSFGDEVVDKYKSGERDGGMLEGVRLWSPSEPNLYSLCVELLDGERVVDTYKERVGFCELSTKKNHFTLNGEDIFLLGVCRHEMLGKDTGHTVSYDEIYSDMKMIKETGCNFVRLVHYPHNKVTLDIADELGLLVCEEPGMWQADVKNEKLTGECLKVLERTVMRDRNHPCISFWLAFNECDFDEKFLKKAVDVCRKGDPDRLVSGANNMPLYETKEQYTRAGLDFYTMHPYSETFDLAREASEVLSDKPLMFTEWGGYYIYEKPYVLSEFLLSMHELYKSDKLAGTCLWYWAEINDYNRGGAACLCGALKEALVDFDRHPTQIYDAFVGTLRAIKNGEPFTCERTEYKSTLEGREKYESRIIEKFDKTRLPCAIEPSYDSVLELAKAPLKTKLAKTRKKQITFGPVLAKEEFSEISKIPYVLGENELIFVCNNTCKEISVLGMASLNYGYPLFGKYGEDVAEITVNYEDGEIEKHTVKNGVDLTIAHLSVGSSRINPVAENARRILEFSYDKNFEEYLVNRLDIKTKPKRISSVTLRALDESYGIIVYGVFI